jgi:hypothetical protein
MKELCKAMAEAFKEIEGAVKDKNNPFFRSKYADLGNVVDAIKPALSNHGLWFIQKIHPTPGIASVETIIMHESGESISCGVTAVPIGKWDAKTGSMVGIDAQAMGAGLTYARRFSLSSAFGVAPEDDDGISACGKDSKKTDMKQEVRKEETPEPKKLGSAELAELSHKIADAMMDDPTLNCVIIEKEMAEFLASWQNKAPLFPALDHLITSNRKKILDSFVQWQNKFAA